METYTLAAMDLKALRQADNICFDHHNGKSGVRCIKRLKKTDPFGEDEKTYHIPIPSSIARGKYTYGFDMLYGYSTYWQTIVNLLRTNDRIRFEFRPDSHTNGYMEKAGLHGDALVLYVERKSKTMVFELATSVCLDNSARMVRYRPL